MRARIAGRAPHPDTPDTPAAPDDGSSERAAGADRQASGRSGAMMVAPAPVARSLRTSRRERGWVTLAAGDGGLRSARRAVRGRAARVLRRPLVVAAQHAGGLRAVPRVALAAVGQLVPIVKHDSVAVAEDRPVGAYLGEPRPDRAGALLL